MSRTALQVPPRVARAVGHLAAWEAVVDAADPRGDVRPDSRRLCAGLAALAEAAADALGGDRSAAGHAAAGLALLTKVDDEHIDSLAFHGGRATDREVLRQRTTAWLAPTLSAVCTGAPGPTPRERLGAEVGRALRRLDDGPRLDALLRLITHGWAVQVEAVVVLSAHPAQVGDAQAAATTQAISDAWLHMIARVGALGASRDFTRAEQEAFAGWGRWIQRADGLADLERELSDGLLNTDPGRVLWHALGEQYVALAEGGRFGALRDALRPRTMALLPPAGALDALADAQADLGELPALLRWIHAMLLSRSPGRVASGEAACSAR